MACTRSPIKLVVQVKIKSRLPEALPISFLASHDPCCFMFLIHTMPWDVFILIASTCSVSF